MLQPHNLQSRISELSIGLGGFDFSRRIAGKYVILRRPGRLLSLVFFRLFGKKSANNKTRIYQGESRNDYFRFHAGIYINVIKQLMKIPGYHLQKINHLNNSSRNWTQPEINTQIIENFVLRHEKPHVSYKSDKIFLFRDQRQVRACQKNSIFSVQNPQSVGLDIQPVEFLRFSGKSSPSSYKNYPSGPHGLLYYTISKFQEKVDISLLEKGRVTKIINYENLSEDALGKNIIYSSYSRSGPANITLNHAHPISISYLQKSYSVGNSGSEIKRVIHSQQSGIQSSDKERQSSGLPLTKILNEIRKERTTIIKRIIHPLLEESRVKKTISYENLSEDAPGKNIIYSPYSRLVSANITLNHTRPINISYLQKSYSVGSFDSDTQRVIHSQQSRIQSSDKERHSSGSPLTKILNEARKERTTNIKRTIHPLLLTHSFSEMAYHEYGINFQHSSERLVLKKPAIQSNDIVFENKEQLQTDKIIPGYANHELLDESGVEKTICYENPSKDAAGKNTLYTSYSRQGPANMALYYIHPINVSYLQKNYNTGNPGSEIKRVIHFQRSGMQSSTQTLLRTHSVSDGAYHEHSINFQYGDNIMGKKILVNARHGGVLHSSKELVLKKPVIQSNDIVSEDKKQSQTDKIIPRYVNDNLIKGHFKEISVHEISTIADRVYKLIERKILIEKDRRGLF